MPESTHKSFECRVAYFISSHGYGHAARAAAVMAAVHEIDPSIRFEIFSTVPFWFFQNSLSGPFNYHFILTDIGLVQKTPLHVDFDRTLQSLGDFLPLDNNKIDGLAEVVHRLHCKIIICDIAPMGIAVARKAGIPSVLIENFTWDWIYQEYVDYKVQIKKHIEYLYNLFHAVDYHIQAEPVCYSSSADLTCLPVSRKIRMSKRKIRDIWGLSDIHKMITITMGGIPNRYHFLRELKDQPHVYFVIPGGSQTSEVIDNLILIPHHTDLYHPDLINASDAVVGKIGYSTLAEVYHAGVPFGYISRPSFRESEVLAKYIEDKMVGFPIGEAEFQNGSWVSHIPDVLALPRVKRTEPNGSEQIADFIVRLLD